MRQSKKNEELLKRVREALELSDALGFVDTSIALNSALVTLDGVGNAGDKRPRPGDRDRVDVGTATGRA
jgi:hypothetical protein